MGNESDMTNAYNGHTTPTIYASNVEQFIANMRQYEANVRTIVNASTASGWNIVNSTTGNGIVVHSYPIYDFPANNQYTTANAYYSQYANWDYNGLPWPNSVINYSSVIRTALNNITKPLFLTETGVPDFSAYAGLGGWPLKNDTARMVLLVDMYISQAPLVPECWAIWTTRWKDASISSGGLLGVLDDYNEFLPTGWAFYALSQYTKDGGVIHECSSMNQAVKISSITGSKSKVLILNKSASQATCEISGSNEFTSGRVFYGNNNDSQIVRHSAASPTFVSGITRVVVPCLSITILE
jgi:hypothetical protein